MTILQLDPYFEINDWIYRDILGALVKNLLNLISFLSIPPNFRRNKNLRFLENRKEWVFPPTYSVLSYLLHFLSLKLSNKRMNFPFPPLKFPNKGSEKYSKIIFFIHFHSIPFSHSKHGLKVLMVLMLKPIMKLFEVRWLALSPWIVWCVKVHKAVSFFVWRAS